MIYIGLLWQLYQSKKNVKKNREQIYQLQRKKLLRLLHHAYKHSPYYHQQFKAAHIDEDTIDTTDFSLFPTLTKEQLIENFDRLVTSPHLRQEELIQFDESSVKEKCFQNQYHIVHSSGSTGTPRYFVYDQNAWNQMLVGIIRGALWNMGMMDILKLFISKPKIVYIAATSGRYGGAMAVGDGIEGIKANQLFLDINLPLQEWLKQIKEFQPNIIIGYPSAIKILAELVEQGQLELSIIRVISCGEPLNKNLRDYLEDLFQAQVVNFYGASESLAIGVEVNGNEGMYLFDDMNYIEVIDGKMYLTSLYNYVQPLIRYQISDRLSIKENTNQDCPFTIVENILGRNEDLMWFDNGKHKDFLHPLAIEGFCVEGLLDYQFYQSDHRSFTMKAQIQNPQDKERIENMMTKEMKNILHDKNLDYVHFSIEFVDEILPDIHTGKKRLIITKNGEVVR